MTARTSRITLAGTRRRVDLALDSTVEVGLLLPDVLQVLDEPPGTEPEGFVLTLPDGRALFIFNQRDKSAPIGIWMAVVDPTASDYGVLHQEPVWQTSSGISTGGEAGHSDWTNFTFGEPAATLLPGGEILLGFWYQDQTDSGIRTVRLRLHE